MTKRKTLGRIAESAYYGPHGAGRDWEQVARAVQREVWRRLRRDAPKITNALFNGAKRLVCEEKGEHLSNRGWGREEMTFEIRTHIDAQRRAGK